MLWVAPNGGWSSYTFAKDNLGRLLEKQVQGKEVRIQYYGDSDPSGERMTADDSKMVKLLNKNDINFERLAITDVGTKGSMFLKVSFLINMEQRRLQLQRRDLILILRKIYRITSKTRVTVKVNCCQ